MSAFAGLMALAHVWQKGGPFLPFRFQLRWAFPGQRRARPPTESSLYSFTVLFITVRNYKKQPHRYSKFHEEKHYKHNKRNTGKNTEQACESQSISDSCKTWFGVEGLSSSVAWGLQNSSKPYHPVTVNLARGFHHLTAGGTGACSSWSKWVAWHQLNCKGVWKWFIIIFSWLHRMPCGILIPQPGSKLALEVQGLNHWAVRGVPKFANRDHKDYLDGTAPATLVLTAPQC